MFRSKLIAITLPAIALASSVPVFADTVTQYEIRRTTNGVTNIVPVMLERQVVQPVFIQRTPAPVVMETYNPPVVVEKRYSRHHHHRDRHLVDIGAPLIHLRAF